MGKEEGVRGWYVGFMGVWYTQTDPHLSTRQLHEIGNVPVQGWEARTFSLFGTPCLQQPTPFITPFIYSLSRLLALAWFQRPCDESGLGRVQRAANQVILQLSLQ